MEEKNNIVEQFNNLLKYQGPEAKLIFEAVTIKMKLKIKTDL